MTRFVLRMGVVTALIVGVMIVLTNLAVQEQKESSMIRASGRATTRVEPDITRIELEISVVDADFGTANDKFAKRVASLANALEQFDLPQSTFDVSSFGASRTCFIPVWYDEMYSCVWGSGHILLPVDGRQGVIAHRIQEIDSVLIHGIEFDRTDRLEIADRLRVDAVRDAIRSVDRMVEHSGFSVTGIREIRPPDQQTEFLVAAFSQAPVEVKIPIEPGLIEISEEMHVTFEIHEGH